jgi:hypothetical protein
MQPFLILANVACLLATIACIHGSERRWVSTGYAALGFVIVVAMGLLSVFVFAGGGNVVEINNRLDTIGNGIQLAAPIAAVFGAGAFGGIRKKKP